MSNVVPAFAEMDADSNKSKTDMSLSRFPPKAPIPLIPCPPYRFERLFSEMRLPQHRRTQTPLPALRLQNRIVDTAPALIPEPLIPRDLRIRHRAESKFMVQ